jgi:hypothetical protein
MRREQLQKINVACFWFVVGSVVSGMAIGIAGIWQYITTENGTLWKLLGTCGAVFLAAMTASMAISWFKANE